MNHSSPAGARLGEVVTFDESAGYGTVRDAHGEWFLHCTAIANGSRAVAVGTAVRFVLAPGHRGRMEARDLRPA
ncbi:MAG: cold shock domain-containing protein [Acidimicrobiales bacterium]